MPLTIETIRELSGKGKFFTGNKNLIEFLFGIDLTPENDYGLVITDTVAYFISPEDIQVSGALTLLCQNGISPFWSVRSKSILDVIKTLNFNCGIAMDTFFESAYYLRYFYEEGYQVKDIGKQIQAMSTINTKSQLEHILYNTVLNLKAYAAIHNNLRTGDSELEAKKIVETVYYEETGKVIPFLADFVAGKNSAQVSGQATNHLFNNGDCLIIDLSPKYQGVYSDTCRTFFAGSITEKQRDIYKILNECMEEGKRSLVPGSTGGEVYQRVYDCLKKYGYENRFPHHAGHTVGYKSCMQPQFVSGSRDVLLPGMVVTLEPGVYFEEEFGIRMEDNYLITEDSFRQLSDIPIAIENYII